VVASLAWFLAAARNAGVVPDHVRLGFTGQAPRLAKGAAQQEFDLRVQAAQFRVRPFLKRLVRGRIDPEQKWFSTFLDHMKDSLWSIDRVLTGNLVAVQEWP
jgi:hypothetical protein